VAIRAPSGAKRPRLVFVCGAVPVVLIALLAVRRPALLARFDASVYDVVLRSVPPRPAANRIVIVDVDEHSLSNVGQWPWPRDIVGRLIARLRDMGAETVALDIIFAETDRYVRFADPTRSPDDLFASILRDGRVILGYGLTFEPGGRRDGACVLHPIGLAIIQSSDLADEAEAPYFEASGVVCSLPLLAEAAGASGFLNAAPDSDGILRRVPLLAKLDGRLYPSLALAAVSRSLHVRDMALRVSNVNASVLALDTVNVPLDAKSNLLLRYRGKKRTFPYLSAADVLDGKASADIVRNKIVLVGTTALGTREVVATPLDTLFAGVEVQATVADNLLQGDFIERSPLGSGLETLTVLCLGLLLAAIVARIGIVLGVVAAASMIVSLWPGAVWLLSNEGVFISPLSPTLAVIFSLTVMTFAKFTVERGRAEMAGREKTAAQRLMVQTLLSLTETRDAETGRHSRRTQQYARLLANELSLHSGYKDQLTPERIDLLSSLAPLHDIGKVGIPDHILNKPGPLTEDELVEMRRHPVLGRDVILKAEQQVGVGDDATLAMAKDIVYTHHERWDGTGYPQGLRGPQIPVAGRVMAIVDVYDAAVGRNLYRPCMTHDEAVDLIIRGSGTHFDPAVVDAFVTVAPVLRSVSEEALATEHR
jgi:adenylate cyclase